MRTGAFVARRNGQAFVTGNSGMPKGLNIAKAIDRMGGQSGQEQAELLKEKRCEAGLSRVELAGRVGCTEASVRDWEEGRSRVSGKPLEWIIPSSEYRLKLAEVLGYSSDEREVIGLSDDRRGDGTVMGLGHSGVLKSGGNTELSERWQGWNTALKPAHEVWWLIRKPLSEGTIAENVLVHGTGAINVDGCRIETTDHLGGGAYGQARKEKSGTWQSSDRSEGKGSGLRPGGAGEFTNPLGRYPSNVIFGHREGCGGGVCISGCPIRELDSQSGETRSGNGAVTASCFERPDGKAGNTYTGNDWMGKKVSGLHYADAGGASRFFYQGDAVEYLTQLITPKGGRVLLVSV